MQRLEGCTEGSEEEVELKAIVDAIEAYEELRWPQGKEQGRKGQANPCLPLVMSVPIIACSSSSTFVYQSDDPRLLSFQ